MGEGSAAVLRRPDELTNEWLAGALATDGGIAGFTVTPIGTGQMSESRRVEIAYLPGCEPGPPSVVLKTASEDQSSRATGVGLGIYEREVRFYRELAPRIGGALAHCHLAVLDPAEGWFTLVLEDVAPAMQGDQISGCTVEQAGLALRELARLHAPVFADPQLAATPWLNPGSPLTQAVMAQILPAFLERYGERVSEAHREVCKRLVRSLDGWASDLRPPLGLVHGDYRLDNMLFGGERAPRPFVVVDWQTVGWGPVMTDAAYFIGGSLTVEDRREAERALLREYLEALREEGVSAFSWEQCWEGYRRQSFVGVLMTVAPAMLVQRTERGDEMFLTTLARYAEQILDLEALELLPAQGSGRPDALRPQPVDEGPHTPGGEQLWNESWYFDAVSEDGATGVYSRIGLYPNLGVCWFTAFVCGPGRKPVSVVRFDVPLPVGDGLEVSGDGLHARHGCIEPLVRFSVDLEALGEEHDDEAGPLRGEPGASIPVELHLEWRTLGIPYSYRATTRYEIPCEVTGTIRLAEKTIRLNGRGQRDHSWGPRDWWSAEWMWSAGHLEDGTRFHGVEFRLPGAPPLGVGYVQPPAGGILELERVSATEDVRDDGLISAARISYDELALEILPLAHGALRLEAPDGRISEFPRAMCRVRAADGRAGLAWVEWNRNASLG